MTPPWNLSLVRTPLPLSCRSPSIGKRSNSDVAIAAQDHLSSLHVIKASRQSHRIHGAIDVPHENCEIDSFERGNSKPSKRVRQIDRVA